MSPSFLTLQEIPAEVPVKQTASQGCAARGEEISCFATPLAREEFASELFILCRALSESKSKTQLELSANDTCALNKNKQSAVRI